MLPVADMSAAVVKVLNRLEAHDSPMTMTITLGWGGDKINANLGAYNKIHKSLPTERVTITRGDSEEATIAKFAGAVARLQRSLVGKIGKGTRPPKGGHLWRNQARRDSVARGRGGE